MDKLHTYSQYRAAAQARMYLRITLGANVQPAPYDGLPYHGPMGPYGAAALNSWADRQWDRLRGVSA